MSELPKGVEKLPRGVSVRGSSIRVNFTYKGVRCFETLPNIDKVNKRTLSYAANKLAVIKTEIKENRFDYARHFPDSERAKAFSGWGGKDRRRSIKQGITSYLEVGKNTLAATTYKSYRHKSQHIINYFGGDRHIESITASDLKMFRAYLIADPSEKVEDKKGLGLSTKTANDVFTVIRGIFHDAYSDRVIENDPTQRIKSLKLPAQTDEADPFERDELERIKDSEKIEPSIKNLILFNSWTGLSISEVMGLAWEDIDLEGAKAFIKRGRVNEEYRVPKEVSRERYVELIEPALVWLKEQKARTFMLKPKKITVVQRDNKKKKVDNVRFVFLNEKTGNPWHQASIGRQMSAALRRAGIRHRSPNQCRHTFASQCLSNFIDKDWIARQLGHTSTAMLKKHYARWITNDTKNMADEVSKKLGFNEDIDGQKSTENVPFTCHQGGKND